MSIIVPSPGVKSSQPIKGHPVASPPKIYWSRKKAAFVITLSVLALGGLTGGVAIALAAGVAVIAGASIAVGAAAGAVSGYLANKRIKKLTAPEKDISSLPSMANKAHALFSQFLGRGEAQAPLKKFPGMDHSLGAHFFGGAFISNATIEGQTLEGNQFSKTASFLKHTLSSGVPDPETEPLMTSIDQVLEIDEKMKQCLQGKDMREGSSEFAVWISEKIKDLPVNQSLLIPGGWRGKPSGHAMLYEVTKQENGKFMMNVINSGAGSHYHPTATIDGKLKHLPYLNQKDIDPDKLLEPIVWRGFFECMNKLPPDKDAYSDKDIYEGFLISIHPEFGVEAHAKAKKFFDPDDYITPQPAGTCSADVLFAYLHARMGVDAAHGSKKKAYKVLKKAITFEALVQYTQFLKDKGYLDQRDNLTLTEIVQRRGIINFLRTSLEKYARGTQKNIKKGWMTKEEGAAIESLANGMIQTLKDADRGYRSKMRKLSSDIQVTVQAAKPVDIQPTAEHGSLFSPSQPDKPEPEDHFSTIGFTIPPANQLHSYLEHVNTQMDKMDVFDRFKLDEMKRMHVILKKIILDLPSPNEDYWNSVPADQVEKCLKSLNDLHKKFLKAGSGVYSTTAAVCAQKVLAIAQRLCENLPEDNPVRYISLGQPSFFTHSLDGTPKNGYSLLTDANVEKELQEVLKFFRDRSQGDKHFFGGNEVVLKKFLENPTDEWKRNEILFACKYLEDHPDIKAKIKERLRVKKDPSLEDIVLFALNYVFALENDTADIFPPSFYLFFSIYRNTREVIGESTRSLSVLTNQEGERYIEVSEPETLNNYPFQDLFSDLSPGGRREYSPTDAIHYIFPYGKDERVFRDEKLPERDQNSILLREIEKNVGPNVRKVGSELALIASTDDRSHQILKNIIYQLQNFESLIGNQAQQVNFSCLLFEAGLLKSFLQADEASATILIDFIDKAYERCRQANDVPNGAYFLRIGSYLLNYCKRENIPQEVLNKFPDFLKELDEWSKDPKLSIDNQSILARDYLAAYARLKPENVDLSHVMNKAFFYADHPIPPSHEYFDEYELRREIRELFYIDLPRKLEESGEQLDAILTKAINPEKATIKWKKDGFVYKSVDGHYSIDLRDCRLYIRGGKSSNLPDNLKDNSTFKELYGNNISEIVTQDESTVSFKDPFNYQNRAKKINNSWVFQKEIDGIWYDFHPVDRHLTPKCQAWQAPGTHDILFMNEGRALFKYDANSKELQCIDKGIRNGLVLDSLNDRAEIHDFFTKFDKNALFWRDSPTHLKYIELPSYNLAFEVDSNNQIRPIPYKEGFRLAKVQTLPALSRLSGYIVLENEKGQREVLVPRRTFKTNLSFTDMFDPALDELDKEPAYYTYQLDAKGRLKSDEIAPRLYLAYLHLIQRNNPNSKEERDNSYELALNLLKHKANKQSAYTEEEIGLLKLIAASYKKTGDKDARAASIRLRAKYLLEENKRNFGVPETPKESDIWRPFGYPSADKEDEAIEGDYLTCLSQKTHAPRFALSQQESLELLKYRNSERLIREREKLQGQERVPEASQWMAKTDKKADFDFGEAFSADGLYIIPKFALVKTDNPDLYSSITRPEKFLVYFPTYYSIARHKSKDSAEGRQLAAFLAMAKRNPELRSKVEILQAVQKNPRRSPTIKNLKKAWELATNSNRKKDLEEMMEEIHGRVESTTSTYAVMYKAQEGIKEEKPKKSEPLSWADHRTLEQPGIVGNNKEKWAASVAQLEAQEADLRRRIDSLKGQKEEVYRRIGERNPDELSKALRSIEKEMAEAFRKLATLEEGRLVAQEADFFTERSDTVELERRKQAGVAVANQLKHKVDTSKNELEKRAAEKLLESVKAYESKLSSKTYILEKDSIPGLKSYLQSQSARMKEHQKNLEKEILSFANKMPLDPTERQIRALELLGDPNKKITLDDLQLLYLSRNPDAFEKLNPSLNEEDSAFLCSMMEDFLLRGIKYNQIQRSLKEIESLEALMASKEEDDPVVIQKMQDVYRAITASNSYDPKRHPEISVFQYKANMTLTPEQISNTAKLMKADQNLVLQMIMGAGKTSVLSVILSLLQSLEKTEKGENCLSILIVPSAIANQVSRLLQTKAGDIFMQKSNEINWEDTSLKNVENIRKRLEDIRKEQGVLLAKGNDIPLFMLQSRIHRNLCCQLDTISPIERTKQEEYRKIKTIFKETGSVLMDEVEFLLNCREEIHIAKGLPKPISPTYKAITEHLYTSLLSDPKITERVYFDFTRDPKPGAVPYTPDMYNDLRKVLTKNAVRALGEKGLYNDQQLKTIYTYLTTKPDKRAALDETLLKDFTKEQKNDLAVLRIELHAVLPHTLNSIHGQHYGVFPTSEKEEPKPENRIAGPYEGVNKPKIGSKLARHEEQQNMTRQAYAKTGIPPKLFIEELKRVRAAVEKEFLQHQLTKPSDAEAYKEFRWLCGDLAEKYRILNLDEDSLAKLAKDLHKAYNKDPLKIQRFVSRYVIPHIKIHEEQTSCNSQYLPSFFKNARGFTGTLPGVNTLHKRFTAEVQMDIDGEMLTSVSKNGPNEILSFNTTDPDSLIFHMMTNTETNNSLAIIDQGGLFKDISQQKLAERILELRPDLKAVVYFEGENQMIRKRGVANPLPHTPQNDVDPTKRLTIYDQIHCRGIHIDQAFDGLAIVTENKNGILASDEQAVFRMRGISKNQNIKYVVPQDLFTILKGSSETPNAVDLALYLQMNQDKQEKEDNLLALRQKMGLVIFEKIDKVLDNIPVANLNQQMYRELEQLTITVNKDNPFEEYGTVGLLEEASKVLQKDRERMLKALIEWQQKHNVQLFNFADMRKEMDELIKHYVDKKLIEEELSTTLELGKTVSVKTSEMVKQKAQVAVKQEQQLQQRQELFERMDMHKKGGMREIHPGRIIDDVEMDRMFEDSEFFKPVKWESSIEKAKEQNQGGSPCWIAMKDLLKEQDQAGVVESFLGDQPFYVPIDLAFVENVSSKENKPFDYYQKPLGFCMIVKEGGQLKFYPLDGKNAERCKQALIKDKKAVKKHEREICLYHPDLGVYQQGANRVKLDELRNDPKFVEMNVMLKLLCGKITGYSEKEREIIKTKLRGQKDLDELRKFFQRVLIKRRSDQVNFPSSSLAVIFKEVANEKDRVPQAA